MVEEITGDVRSDAGTRITKPGRVEKPRTCHWKAMAAGGGHLKKVMRISVEKKHPLLKDPDGFPQE